MNDSKKFVNVSAIDPVSGKISVGKVSPRDLKDFLCECGYGFHIEFAGRLNEIDE